MADEKQDDDKKKVEFHYPPHTLKEKVGDGGIPMIVLVRAQDIIEETSIDFDDHAEKIIRRLDQAIAEAKGRADDDMCMTDKQKIFDIIGPVMELKANGKMFRYELISEIAGVVLNFLENVDELNQDGFEIVDVHQKTLQAIIKNKLTGDGGKEGYSLALELYEACKRYYEKYDINPNTS